MRITCTCCTGADTLQNIHTHTHTLRDFPHQHKREFWFMRTTCVSHTRGSRMEVRCSTVYRKCAYYGNCIKSGNLGGLSANLCDVFTTLHDRVCASCASGGQHIMLIVHTEIQRSSFSYLFATICKGALLHTYTRGSPRVYMPQKLFRISRVCACADSFRYMGAV